VELDLNELWAVDVTAPDIETKSYMRNTLASENRRRMHTNKCKAKEGAARQLALVEAGGQEGSQAPAHRAKRPSCAGIHGYIRAVQQQRAERTRG